MACKESNLARILELTEQLNSAEENEQRIRKFMDFCPAVAFIKDSEGRILYINRACEERFGVLLTDWKGKATEELGFPDAVAKSVISHDDEVIRERRAKAWYEVTSTIDGERIHKWLVLKFQFRDTFDMQCLGGIALELPDGNSLEIT